jgi:AcrR family transcriptional regulator
MFAKRLGASYRGRVPSITRPRRNAERREEIEQNLLQAVESLLSEGWSFTELSVQRIADEAGIPRSTFYLHFPDKAQLIMRLTGRVYDEVFGETLAWYPGDHRDGPEGMTRALEGVITRFRLHFPVLRAVMEVAGYEPAVGAFYRSRILEFAAAMETRLQLARQAGQLHPAVHIPTTTQIMCWSTERSIIEHILGDPEGAGDHRLAEALARVQWLTMYGDARRPPAPVRRGP